MNRISKARQARIDAGEERLNYGSTIGQRTGERKKPSLDDLKKKGLVEKASSLPPPSRKMRARSPNNHGWYRWAVENVWSKRERKCEVCGWSMEFMESDPYPGVFSHLLPRGSYRKYKTDERNVIIKCPSCHGIWHAVGPKYLKDDKKWAKVVALYNELRAEANGVSEQDNRK
jgi:hypothetical protein